MSLVGIPSNRLRVIIDFVHNVENQSKQGHADQHAVIGLPENRQIWVLIQVLVQFLSLSTESLGNGCMITVFGAQFCVYTA